MSQLCIRWPKYCPFPNPPNGSNSSKDAIPEEASRCAVGPSSYLTAQLLYGVDQGVVWFLLVKEANQFAFFSCLFIHFFFLRIWWKSMEAMKASLVKDLFTAAASRQSCPTLCDPIDSNPPGSSVPGTVQARTLEWVAISFSNACMYACQVPSVVSDSVWPYGQQPTRLLCPQDSLGKNTRVGYHFLLQKTCLVIYNKISSRRK